MCNERPCPRCQGVEFRVTRGSLQGWPEVSHQDEHWYCPRCDWGRLCREEDEALVA